MMLPSVLWEKSHLYTSLKIPAKLRRLPRAGVIPPLGHLPTLGLGTILDLECITAFKQPLLVMPVVQPPDQLEDEIPRNSEMPIFGCRAFQGSHQHGLCCVQLKGIAENSYCGLPGQSDCVSYLALVQQVLSPEVAL